MRTIGSLVLLAAMAVGSHAEDVDVYILAGQSNAAGMGLVSHVTSDPGGYGSTSTILANPDVLLWHSATLAGGSSANTWTTLAPAPEAATPARFGPEISLGNRLLELNPGRKIAIVKHARGTTSLHTNWDIDSSANNEWDVLAQTVHSAVQALIANGDTPIIRGMAWQQGERDANPSATTMAQADAYGQNLRDLILAARSEFNAPNMMFVYGRILQKISNSTYAYEQRIRDGQDAVAEGSGSPLETPGAFITPSDDLTTNYGNDLLHLDYIGQLELGHRFAEQFGTVPEPSSACLLAPAVGLACGRHRRQR